MLVFAGKVPLMHIKRQDGLSELVAFLKDYYASKPSVNKFI
jgi:hypothetical protein